MKKLNILIVEDGHSQREMLRDFLIGEGHSVSTAETGEEALDQVSRNHYELLLLDYKMPGMNGIEVLEAVRIINPEIDIILMTAFGTIETAVKAMKSGAADYITKPIDLDDLLLHIDRISERRTLIRENEVMRNQLKEKGITTEQIIYRSRSIQELVNMAGRVASSRSTVLISGESGTGKELMAKLIHSLSPRAERPIVVVNCGAIHENLLESELFGHERGAFTGAMRRRIGKFEEADGGTLFMDEIGELSLLLQVKLLRFLQEREFQRLGGNEVMKADVRIISATNRELEAMVNEGTFREDLFYRLNVVSMSMPPLRERKDDIPPLIEYFLNKFSSENGRNSIALSLEARDLMMKYDYPGNVRELENIIERAVVISRDSVITSDDLPFRDRAGLPEKKTESKMKESVEAMESRMIREAMLWSGNNQSKAADQLGISERMLRYKLKKYNLKP